MPEFFWEKPSPHIGERIPFYPHYPQTLFFNSPLLVWSTETYVFWGTETYVFWGTETYVFRGIDTRTFRGTDTQAFIATGQIHRTGTRYP